jgi:hypothetical protein
MMKVGKPMKTASEIGIGEWHMADRQYFSVSHQEQRKRAARNQWTFG